MFNFPYAYLTSIKNQLEQCLDPSLMATYGQWLNHFIPFCVCSNSPGSNKEKTVKFEAVVDLANQVGDQLALQKEKVGIHFHSFLSLFIISDRCIKEVHSYKIIIYASISLALYRTLSLYTDTES